MKNDPYAIFSLKNKVIIITGGAGLLGLHYARALADSGAHVIVWDTKKIPRRNGDAKIRFEVIDITDEVAVRRAVQQIVKEHRRIDALINNAAMNPAVGSADAAAQFVPYEDYPLDLWEKELKVNLTGMMICTKAVAPIMMKQRAGSIVNVASEVSVIAHDHRVYNDPRSKKFKSIAYTTSKTAVVGFTRQWAARLGAYNVRVNALSPGGVETAAQPRDFVKRFGSANMLGRMARADEYNGIILFLCSDASSFMTGHNLVVDGGKSAW